MDFDFEQLILAHKSRSKLLISLEFLLQSLVLDCQIVHNASKVFATTLSRGKGQAWRLKVPIWESWWMSGRWPASLFVGVVTLLLKERGVDYKNCVSEEWILGAQKSITGSLTVHCIGAKFGSRILVGSIIPLLWITFTCVLTLAG